MTACALALVLLMDVSGSVSTERFALQRDGTAHAFANPRVAAFISPDRPVAVTAIQWASSQHTVLPWRILRDAADLAAADTALAAHSREESGLTGLGDALQAGVSAFATMPCAADRQVIDISGDGASNTGAEPEPARQAAINAGITINGLPIVTEGEPTVADYYRKSVVTPDGFVVEAHGFDDVARAMGRKLAAEIAGAVPGMEWAGR